MFYGLRTGKKIESVCGERKSKIENRKSKIENFFISLILLTALLFSVVISEESGKSESPYRLASEKQTLEDFLPRSGDIEGLTRRKDVKKFIPENLWEYLNGEADTYLSYGFQKLVTAEYYIPKDPMQTIVLDIYDMGTLERGFGIYSSERNIKYEFEQIGSQAFLDEMSVRFFKGRYFVKITTFEISESLQDLMKKLAINVSVKIKQPLDFPPQLDRFPEQNRVKNSEKLIYKNFLSKPDFDKVYTVDYKVGAVTYSLFYAKYDSQEEASKVYITIQKHNPSFTSPIRNLQNIGNEAFRVVTKYHKGLVVARDGDAIYGGCDTAYPDEVLVQMRKMNIK